MFFKAAVVLFLCFVPTFCDRFNGSEPRLNGVAGDKRLIEMDDGGEAENRTFEEGRKKKEQDMMTKILPMMIIPFMMQTAIIPMMLMMLKMMLIKSAFLGKMAIVLGLINLFVRSNNQGGVFTHNVQLDHEGVQKDLAQQHYGYNGGSEYGMYLNYGRSGLR